jgi:group I intron endonuclease
MENIKINQIKSGIYGIENTVNKKIYIGSAVNLRRRFKDHRVHLKQGNHHSQKLQRAWNKYGKDVFKFSVVEPIEDINKLIEREQYWINFYNACGDTGYNICPTAGSCLGIIHTPERRALTSEIKKHQSVETKAKISATLKGHPVSEETKAKLRTHRPTSEAIEKLIAFNTGRKQSPEQIEKRIQKIRGRKLSAEVRAKMSAIQKGRKYPDRIISDETRAKYSAARLGKKLSPETISKIKEKKSSPEFRAALSEKMKAIRASQKENRAIA